MNIALYSLVLGTLGSLKPQHSGVVLEACGQVVRPSVSLKYQSVLREAMNRSVAFVPVLLALLLLVPVASAAYTGPWGITLRDNLGKPIDTSQGLDGGANFTIQIWVGSTSVGSARYL